MGDETLIVLLRVTSKKHPLLIKRIGTTHIRPRAQARRPFSRRYTSKTEFGNALSAPAPCA